MTLTRKIVILLAGGLGVVVLLAVILWVDLWYRWDYNVAIPVGTWQVTLTQTESNPCPVSDQGKTVAWQFTTRRAKDGWEVQFTDGRKFSGEYDPMNGLWAYDQQGAGLFISFDGQGNFPMLFFPRLSETESNSVCLSRYAGSAICQARQK